MTKLILSGMLAAAILIVPACSKKAPPEPQEVKCSIPDQLCDSAQLVVGNKTNETIYFNKGEGGTNVDYYLSVAPGGTTTFKTSGTEVRFNSDCSVRRFQGPIQGIKIPSMYFTVKMNRCVKKVHFIEDESNSIRLEIEDKD